MLDIGDKVRIKEDHRTAYIYDTYIDSFLQPYYQVVWYEEDLYKRWPSHFQRIIFWTDDLVEPKTKTLKNGNKIIISR